MKNINYKTNYPLFIGNIASFIYFGIGHFISFPDFFGGLMVGIAISGYILGLYGMRHDLSRIQCFKKSLFVKH